MELKQENIEKFIWVSDTYENWAEAEWGAAMTRQVSRKECVVGSEELGFHESAVKLLQKVLTITVNLVPRREWKDKRKGLIEVSRILASNLVIAHHARLELKEVNKNPELGLTEISVGYRGGPRSRSQILGVLRKTEWPKLLNAFDEGDKLSPYQLAKLIAAIHEVTVYGKLELSFNDGGLQVQSDGTDVKRQRGAFYTPAKVTRFICENTLGRFLDEKIESLFRLLDGGERANSSKIFEELEELFCTTVVDPACGPGAFLIESLMVARSRYPKIVEICRRLERAKIIMSGRRGLLSKWRSIIKNESNFLKYFQGRVYGVDLDPAAVEVASICLSFISGRPDLKYSFCTNLKQGNSLISELPLRCVKPRSEELERLSDLREQVKKNKIREKKKLLLAYRERIDRIQESELVPDGIKRASDLFGDLRGKEAFCWELEFPEVFLQNKSDDGASSGFDVLVMNPPYRILKLNRSEFGLRQDSGGEFEELKVALERESEFFRKSGRYRLATTGVLNYYKLMVEQALNLTSRTSFLGFIVPSTLLCDRSAEKLRREFLLKYEVIGLFDFLERASVFRGVNQAVCIVLLEKSHQGKFVHFASNLEKLDMLDFAKPHTIPLDLITALSEGLSIPKVEKWAWPVLKKMHRNQPLSKIPWIQNLRGEVDLTIYRDCISPNNTGNALVRGNHIARYVLKWHPEGKESFVFKDRFLKKLGNSAKGEHVRKTRIVGQQVSNMIQRWRLKFCRVPPGTFLGNSCNYLLIFRQGGEDESPLLFMLALLNSCLLNWRFKLTSTNNHISNYELGSLPIKLVDQSNSQEKALFDLVVRNVKHVLRAGKAVDIVPEIEAAIFLLYGLAPEEVLSILKSDGAKQREIEDIMEHFHKLSGATQ